MDIYDNPIQHLIGFHTISRPYESAYAFISRLIRCNFLTDNEVRRLIPKIFVDTSFFPDSVEIEKLGLLLQPYLPDSFLAGLKSSSAQWSPYPYLDSSPPERLRGCPACLKKGSHSFAFQGDLIALCPLHNEPLTYNCFRCGAPLFWKSAKTFSESAFRCSRGCDLLESLFAGLEGIHAVDLDEHLERHLKFVDELRSELEVISGPGYVPYPLRLQDKSIDMPGRPSLGLLPALLRALRPYAPKLPEFHPYHGSQCGAWRISVEGWTSAMEDNHVARPLDVFEMQRLFNRSAYHTTLPRPKTPFDPSLADDLIQQSVAILKQGEETIDVPSHLLTNGDFFALRRLYLERNHAHRHYEVFLTNLLKRGIERHQAVWQIQSAIPGVLELTEWASLIVQVSTGTFRVSAETRHPENVGLAAWKSYTDWAQDDARHR